MSSTSSVLLALAFALVLCHLASAQAGSWEDCKTTKMVLKNTWIHNNIDVIAYSRLSAGQSVADCLAKCRANQECYSFNYNKLTKWCYIGTTEEIMLRQTRNSKWASGVRRCVEHVGNAPWTNDEFAGGAEGTGPTPVTAVSTIDATAVNTLNLGFTAPTTPGTTADGSASAIAFYKITCSATTGSYPAVTKVVAGTTACTTPATAGAPATGCAFGGLAVGASYTCSIVAINNEGVESPAAISSPAVTIA